MSSIKYKLYGEEEPQNTQSRMSSINTVKPVVNMSSTQTTAMGTPVKQNTVNNANSGNSGNDETWVREMMIGLGMDNNKIGYNDNTKTVTYDGMDFISANERDGKSYASKASIQNAYNNYANKGNQVVATDYLGGTASPYSYGYHDGKFTVNGISLDTALKDGKSYVYEKDLLDALNKSNANSGLQNNSDILNKYEDKYSDIQSQMLDRIINREDFSYDPAEDELFKAYQAQYTREGNRAMQDTLGKSAALTGGFNNSAAVNAAGQARQYYSDKLMDRIPELEANAYSRYINDYNMDRQGLSDIQNAWETEFNRSYNVNRDTYNDILNNRSFDYNRETDNWQKAWTDAFNEQNYRTNEKDIYWNDAINTQQYEANKVQNTQAELAFEYQKSMQSGNGIPTDRFMELTYGINWRQQFPSGKPSMWDIANSSFNNVDLYQSNTLADAEMNRQKQLMDYEDKIQRGQMAYQKQLSQIYGGSSSSSGGSKSSGGSSKSSGNKAMTASQYNTFTNKVRQMQKDKKSDREIANYIENLGLSLEDKARVYNVTGVSRAVDIDIQNMKNNGASDAEIANYLIEQSVNGLVEDDFFKYMANKWDLQQAK